MVHNKTRYVYFLDLDLHAPVYCCGEYQTGPLNSIGIQRIPGMKGIIPEGHDMLEVSTMSIDGCAIILCRCMSHAKNVTSDVIHNNCISYMQALSVLCNAQSSGG